jgi:hypothetical protein
LRLALRARFNITLKEICPYMRETAGATGRHVKS